MQLKRRVMLCPKISPQDKAEPGDKDEPENKSPYEKLMHTLHSDPKWLEEVTLDRRVGLYKFRQDLGRGNFSQVKLAVHQLTNERVAIKIIDKGKLDENAIVMLNQEISTMETVYHPNLIRLYEVVETYSKLYLVMEFANGGDLFSKIVSFGKLGELTARPLFLQICSAVEHLHKKNIIHRDIKAENVIFSGPNQVKLGDFGLSVQLTEGPNQLLSTICGTPESAAPELFHGTTYVGGPVDVWALGILLYMMVFGVRPFGGKNLATLKKNILSGEYKLPSDLSRECANLIEGILRQKPEERLSVSGILASDWLQGVHLPSLLEASHSYILTPTVAKYSPDGAGDLQLSDIEQTARERLSKLGISSQLLASHSGQGSRSHIIGCYRIVVHRIQRQLGVFIDLDGHVPVPEPAKVPEKKFLLNNFCLRSLSGNNLFSNCWRRKASSDEEFDGRDGKERREGFAVPEKAKDVEKEPRFGLLRSIQAKSVAVKGGEENLTNHAHVIRSKTCAIL